MLDIKQFEEAYAQKQRESLDAAIELALARQGIDPAKVSKKDFDQIRRYNRQLTLLSEKRPDAINKLNQDFNAEYGGIVLELNKISLKIKQEQCVLPGTDTAQTPVESNRQEDKGPAAEVIPASHDLRAPVA